MHVRAFPRILYQVRDRIIWQECQRFWFIPTNERLQVSIWSVTCSFRLQHRPVIVHVLIKEKFSPICPQVSIHNIVVLSLERYPIETRLTGIKAEMDQFLLEHRSDQRKCESQLTLQYCRPCMRCF